MVVYTESGRIAGNLEITGHRQDMPLFFHYDLLQPSLQVTDKSLVYRVFLETDPVSAPLEPALCP
jgi:hypothetical protein